MYHLKKNVPVEDDIELLDASGKVVRTIHVSICMDKLLGRYNETINALKSAEIAIDPKDEQSLEAYGQIVVQLLRLIFGADADVILAHYDGRYLEMLDNIMPYIFHTIGPELRKPSRHRMDALQAARVCRCTRPSRTSWSTRARSTAYTHPLTAFWQLWRL